jgi:ABC-type amino acid transport system permease subunit
MEAYLLKIQWADPRLWLGVCLFLLFAQSWVMWSRAWRSEPPGLMWRTFMDARGQPDGKLATAFLSVLMLVASCLVKWIWNRDTPLLLQVMWFVLVLIGIGADIYLTRRVIDLGALALPASLAERLQAATGPPEQPAAPEPTTNS